MSTFERERESVCVCVRERERERKEFSETGSGILSAKATTRIGSQDNFSTRKK